MKTAIRQILFSSPLFDIKQVSPSFSIDVARSSITLNGSTVAQINGLYDNSNASQATAANQPTYQATGFNGFPCLSFDGVDDQLAISVPQAYNQDIFAVVDTVNVGIENRLFLNRIIGTSPFPPALYFGGTSGSGGTNNNPSIFWGSGAAFKVNPTVTTQKKCIIRFKLGNPCEIQVDGGTIFFGTNAETILSTWSTICTSGTQQSQILLKEMHIISSANLTLDIRDKIYADLAKRSGLVASLPDSNPYKNRTRIAR